MRAEVNLSSKISILLLMVPIGLFCQTEAERRTLLVPYNDGTIAVDGSLADWGGFRIHTLDSENLVRGSARESSSDLSADFWLAWNAEGLFVAADIRDDQWRGLTGNDQIWNTDALIISISYPQAPNSAKQQYFMISTRENTATTGALQGNGRQFNLKECSSFTAIATEREAGPLLEVFIGWNDINHDGSIPPRGLQLNLEIRDFDDGSRRSISWLPVSASPSGEIELSPVVLIEPEEAEVLPGDETETGYRSFVNLVEVPAVITDQSNKVIEGLTEEEIIVLEDDVPQKVREVRFEQRPVTISLLMDRSGSMKWFLRESKNTITHFLRALREEDQSMLIIFNHSIEMLKDVGGSAEEAIEALDEITAEGDTAFYSAVYFAIRQLQYLREKKVIIVLSDGLDESLGNEPPYGVRPSLREIIEECRRHEIVVYPVAFRIQDTAAMQELNQLADETGGRVLLAQDAGDLDKAYAEIAEELKSQYYITYQSDNQAMDGHWREITIEVKDQDATIRAKPGYYAPSR